MIHESLSEVLSKTSAKRLAWIGTASFERRCVGSVELLLNEGYPISRSTAFDYPTKLNPQNAGEQRRAANKSHLNRLLGDSLTWRQINPYRYAEFVGELDRLYADLGPEFHIIIDITCLTKIHTLACAYWLLERRDVTNVIIAYSQPEYYGNPSRSIWGKGRWQSPVVVRLDLNSTELYTSTSTIVLVGHEGDRLRLALSELEPATGVVIKSLPRRPDSPLLTVSDVQNAWLYSEINEGLRPGFSVQSFGMKELEGLCAVVRNHCESAKRKRARVVLCPFGPKLFIFATGLQALSTYPENIWLSYPRPFSYDPDYSEGYKYTLWIDPQGVNYFTAP